MKGWSSVLCILKRILMGAGIKHAKFRVLSPAKWIQFFQKCIPILHETSRPRLAWVHIFNPIILLFVLGFRFLMILHGKFDRNHDLLSITYNHVRLKQEFLPSQSSAFGNKIKISTPISKHLRLSPPMYLTKQWIKKFWKRKLFNMLYLYRR